MGQPVSYQITLRVGGVDYVALPDVGVLSKVKDSLEEIVSECTFLTLNLEGGGHLVAGRQVVENAIFLVREISEPK